MSCVVSAIAWTVNVFSTDKLRAQVWILATYLNLGNFLSDHQLLNTRDLHDVLCRLGNRMDCEHVLHRQTGLWCGFLPLT